MNKIEVIKSAKDGLDILDDIPAFSRDGWETIPAADRDRLKWAGVFFRRQTPGRFMMRVRISNGISTADQFRTLAAISADYGMGFADLTTRQQIQLRDFAIEQVPDIWDRLASVGLISLQTGMDNIRTVVGCPVAGLTPNELLDAAPIAEQFTNMFIGNREYTNLPRKFNVTITGCRENCTHADTQDVALTPAIKEIDGVDVAGFNVSVGGKMGSGGYTPGVPLDLFVTPDDAAAVCSHIALLFRDHGSRAARNKTRLAFLLADWGVDSFRAALASRAGHPLHRAGADARNADQSNHHTDHIGVHPQQQPGLNYIGLCVPVGRITAAQLRGVADLADRYGNGAVRITPGQNLIIPNIPDAQLAAITAEPLLQVLSYRPAPAARGTVSCTGIDYCHFALIETKDRAAETARALATRIPDAGPVSIYWSGCANGCANHTLADIGLVGRRIRKDGAILEAVDIYRRGEPQAPAQTGVLCSDLPAVLEQMLTPAAGPVC